MVGNKRQTFRIRFLRASDVLSIAQKVISITSLKVIVNQGGGVGREAPKEKNAPESELIGNTLLVADGVANTLIVHGPPKHIQVIRDLIAAIDVDLDLEKKDPNANPATKFEKRKISLSGIRLKFSASCPRLMSDREQALQEQFSAAIVEVGSNSPIFSYQRLPLILVSSLKMAQIGWV